MLPTEPEAVLIAEGSAQDSDAVNQPAETEEPEREQIQNAGADLADIETVDTKLSKEKAQSQSEPTALGRSHCLNATAAGIIRIGVGIGIIDYDGGLLGLDLLGSRLLFYRIFCLLGSFRQSSATAGTESCAGGDVRTAAGALGNTKKFTAVRAVAYLFLNFSFTFGTDHGDSSLSSISAGVQVGHRYFNGCGPRECGG